MFTIIALALMSNFLWAREYLFYTPGTTLSLGAGFDHQGPFQNKERCIDIKKVEWVHVDAGVIRAQLKSTLVKNRSELTDFLSLDIGLSAKAKFKLVDGSISIDHNMLKEFKNFSDSLNYMVEAKYDFGEKEIVELELKAIYQELLNQEKFEEFQARCGTHFVISTQQEIAARLLFSVEDLTTEDRKEMTFKLNSNVDAGPVGGSVRLQLVDKINEMNKRGRVKLTVDSFGGDARLFNQFASANDIEKAMAAMENFLGSASKETSIPSRFTLASYERFGLKIPRYDNFKESFFEKAYLLLLEIESRQNKLKTELSNWGRLNTEGVSNLHHSIFLTYKANQLVERAVKNCQSDVQYCEEFYLPILPEMTLLNDLLENLKITYHCYSLESPLQVVLEGEFKFQKLIDINSVIVERDSVSLGSQQFNLKELPMAWSPDGKRFRGVIELLPADFQQVKELGYRIRFNNALDKEIVLMIQKQQSSGCQF